MSQNRKIKMSPFFCSAPLTGTAGTRGQIKDQHIAIEYVHVLHWSTAATIDACTLKMKKQKIKIPVYEGLSIARAPGS
jgi:hypothetical protein